MKADRTKFSDEKYYLARTSDHYKLGSAGHSLENDLRVAAAKGNTEVVEVLLKNGADINAQCGEYGNALQAAAANGNIEVVKVLLENGASAADAKMEQHRLLTEGSKPTPETYYYGLQAGLKLIASTIPNALNQTLPRDPTDAGFFFEETSLHRWSRSPNCEQLGKPDSSGHKGLEPQ